MNTAMCNCCFWCHDFKSCHSILPFALHQKCVSLNLKVTRFVRTFCQRIKTVIFIPHNENSNISVPVGFLHVYGYKI